MKLLLDENITPAAATALCEAGIDTYHVRDRGLLGATDAELLARAIEEDRILVTLNVGDFEELIAAEELHPGIVLIETIGLRRHEQIALLRRVFDVIERRGADTVNRVFRVAQDGTIAVTGE